MEQVVQRAKFETLGKCIEGTVLEGRETESNISDTNFTLSRHVVGPRVSPRAFQDDTVNFTSLDMGRTLQRALD